MDLCNQEFVQIRTARAVFMGAGLKWPNTAGQYSTLDAVMCTMNPGEPWGMFRRQLIIATAHRQTPRLNGAANPTQNCLLLQPNFPFALTVCGNVMTLSSAIVVAVGQPLPPGPSAGTHSHLWVVTLFTCTDHTQIHTRMDLVQWFFFG